MSGKGNIEDLYPLSPLQEGMLFHTLAEPASGVFVEQLVAPSSTVGELDSRLLERVLGRLVERHPVLRTAFVWHRQDRPIQLVLRRVSVPLEEHDWRRLDDRARRRRLASFLDADRRRGFDLSRVPLCRFSLLRAAGDGGTDLLVFTYHHILLDGWSVPLLIEELQALYRGVAAGVEPELPRRRPYRDFIEWLAGRDLEAAERFWHRQLRGFTTATPIQIERRRRAGGGYGEHRSRLPAATAEALSAFARRSGSTLATVVHGAWALLLARYSGEEDVVYGATVLGRPEELAGAESMVGLFINTLPVRVRVDPGAPALPWLRRLQERLFELRRYEHTPLIEIQKWSEVPAGRPLFESLLDFEVPRAGAGDEEGGVTFERTNFPLALDVQPGAAGIALRLGFDRSRFTGTDTGRLLHHFRQLLEELPAAAERPLGELPPVAPIDHHRLLREWNDRAVELPAELRCHRLFARRAARSPEAVAIAAAGRQLSYRELARRAGRLARHLRRLGVGPEVLVAVCLERTERLVVALLAILEAGGAYLPLDPSYPRRRLSLMCGDSGVEVLVSESSLAGRRPEVARVIELDRPAPADGDTEVGPAVASDPGEETVGDGRQLAYVIYTSGSTGRPKGVQIEHRTLANFLFAMRRRPGLGAGDRLLAVTSISFDIAALELFLPLLVGARIELVDRSTAADGGALAARLAASRATAMQATPATWRLLLAAGWQPAPKLAVLCGGEALPPELAAELLPGAGALWNLYGPTETTVWSAVERPRSAAPPIAVGQPIDNTTVQLVDRRLRPVPPGVTGELLIGGDGLARGYLGRPALTAERFVPDPWCGGADPSAARPGRRLYRTGDLARRLPDGRLECLGRLDHQLKIRGFRVESGEIESALTRHPGVRQAVVSGWEAAPGERRLVAYLVPDGASEPAAEELREHLERSLPEYMVPSVFVPLPALPLTPNGKIDRRALPAPDGRRHRLRRDFVPPRSPEEAALVRVWAEVLGVDRVGVEDDFYALGGDSMLAVRVLVRARREGFDFTLEQLVHRPTVAGLIRSARGAEDAGETLEPVPPLGLVAAEDLPALPASAVDAYPLTGLQGGMLFHGELRPESGLYHDVFCYRLELPWEPRALAAAVDRVVARHPVLRTGFDLDRFSEPLQLVHRRVPRPLAVVDLEALDPADQEAEEARWLADERRRGFDWSRPPLLRLVVHRRGGDRLRLALSFHHAILDGWSVAALLAELFARYAAIRHRRPEPDPAPPAASFRDYVALERRAIGSEATGEHWRRALDGASPTLLPRWPEVARRRRRHRVRVHAASVPPAVSSGLERLAAAAGVPLKSVVLAAHLRVQGLAASRTDVVTGLVANGRPETEGSEEVLGLFLNTLPLRLELRDEPWLELARRCFDAERRMLPHRRLPLAEIQRRSGGRELFETTLNFQHFRVWEESALGSSEVRVSGRETFEATNYTLAVNFRIAGTDSGFTLDYDAGELGAPQVAALAGYYLRALTAMARDPGGHGSALSLLSPAERHQLLVEWNDSHRPPPAEPLAHRAISARAARVPDAVAVICGRHHLSYRALIRRAEDLARRLAARGVGRGARVGISAQRSPEMPVALLGTLLTGAAYVPLDPDYPARRLATILEDADVALLLTEERLLPILPAIDRPTELLGPRAEPPADAVTPAPPSPGPEPEELAYVIFTSGSTGRPKGVQIPHLALANFLASMAERPGLTAGDRLLAVTTLSFDIAGLELYLPLLLGATVVLAEGDRVRDGARLRSLLERSRATAVQATPAGWRLLLEAGWHGRPGLVALCGGEALPPPLATELRRLCGGLWNLYGPTETTIWSAVRRVGGDLDRGSVAVGRPIANTAIHLLDHALVPVPVAVPGELMIGGDGLARGYLGRPGLTAERFVPDPWGGEPGVRLYRTGDLARRRADGAVEYLGRLDQQVKIRGFRVELGEIETALDEHPGVARAVAAVWPAGPEDHRLVAYLVAAGEPAPDADELRRSLRGRLPEYMVPQLFTVLDRLPETPNGKVDRKALPPPPELAGEAREATATPPRNPTEGVLAAIWSEVLGVDRIGVEDGFLELGGHSLLATRILARVRRAFGVELPLRTLFEAPTIAGMASQLAGRVARSAARGWPKEVGRKLVKGVARGVGRGLAPAREANAAEPPPLEPVSRDRELPLSFAQERLWFLDQLAPGLPTYNLSGSVRLGGEIETAPLRAALELVTARHEVLRCAFPAVEGRATLVVSPPGAHPLPEIDLRRLGDAAREPELGRLNREHARRPFDLTRGPLFRTSFVLLGAAESALLLTVHHIVSDGWSMGLLVGEMSTAYRALRRREAPSLPALPLQYADFAAWQRRWLRGRALESALAYWRRRLGGAPPLLDLPTDRPRPPVQTFRGAGVPFRFDARLTGDLRRLGRRFGATSFMVLLSVFKALIGRWSQCDDITVGTPVAGRNWVEIEELIGFFTNTLVLRTDVDGGASFRELLERVRKGVLEADAHQDVPFEKLVEELVPERSLEHSPLFQLSFAHQLTIRAPDAGDRGAGGVELSSLPAATGFAKFDLTLLVFENRDTVDGWLELNTHLFDRTTILRLATQLERLARAVAAHPLEPMAAAPILGEAERQLLLREWNDTGGGTGEGAPIHRRVEERARRAPDSLAVAADDRRLSYGELDRRANGLARHLRSLGVGPEVRVGLYLDRCPELVIGALAVLKAGGGYVPFDPSYPAGRLDFLIDDARISIVLTRTALRSRLPATIADAARTIELDAEPPAGTTLEATELAGSATPHDLAYVIYTSGSTGRPKGVQISHAGLANLVDWHHRSIRTTPDDRATMVASPGFDASVWELWPNLAAGASVHTITDDSRLGPENLWSWLAAEAITVCFLPTPVAAVVLERPRPLGLALRWLLTGGDRLRRAPSQELPFRLANCYGPTECTVLASWARVPAGDARIIPTIGRPLDGLRIRLLDRHLRPVPIGSVGELCVAGRGLARGYLERPGTTAAAFVPDPFSTVGGRLYRTGDLARHRAGGEMEFRGRADHQIKLRGFRIELGEIESILERHPGVARSVAILEEDSRGLRMLVAFVVPAGSAPETAELRGFLTERLPPYMVPTFFVPLDELPLDAHGKIDRRALRLPEEVRRGSEAESEEPRTAREEALAAVWRDVLGLSRVGIHDSFFRLGGDSILSLRMVAKARRAGLELTPQEVFQHPTIAGLAAVAGTPAERREEGPLTGEVPLLPIQRWFFEQPIEHRYHFNQAVFLEVAVPLELTPLGAAVAVLVDHHDALRLRFHRGGGGWRQLCAVPGGEPPVTRIDLAGLPPRRRIAALEAAAAAVQTSLDLEAGPILRVASFDLGAGAPERLLVVIHHLAVDGVSWRILLEDLQDAYRRAAAGEAVTLPPRGTSLRRWSELLRRHAAEADLSAELAYWSPERWPPATPPAGLAAGGAPEGDTTVSLDPDETERLLRTAPDAYHARVDELLVTALAHALASATDAPKLQLDLEGHGREEIGSGIDLTRTAGWFTALYPVALELPGGGLEETLRAVKEQLRAVPGRGFGYGVLRYLSPDPEIRSRLRELPPSAVVFNYLGQLDPGTGEGSILRPAAESAGPTAARRGSRERLEVNAAVTAGRLEVTFEPGGSAVATLAGDFLDALRRLLDPDRLERGGAHTATDFPLAELEDGGLERLAAALEELDDGAEGGG